MKVQSVQSSPRRKGISLSIDSKNHNPINLPQSLPLQPQQLNFNNLYQTHNNMAQPQNNPTHLSNHSHHKNRPDHPPIHPLNHPLNHSYNSHNTSNVFIAPSRMPIIYRYRKSEWQQLQEQNRKKKERVYQMKNQLQALNCQISKRVRDYGAALVKREKERQREKENKRQREMEMENCVGLSGRKMERRGLHGMEFIVAQFVANEQMEQKPKICLHQAETKTSVFDNIKPIKIQTPHSEPLPQITTLISPSTPTPMTTHQLPPSLPLQAQSQNIPSIPKLQQKQGQNKNYPVRGRRIDIQSLQEIQNRLDMLISLTNR